MLRHFADSGKSMKIIENQDDPMTTNFGDITWVISLETTSRCRSIEDPLIVRSTALSAWNFPAKSSPRHRSINLPRLGQVWCGKSCDPRNLRDDYPEQKHFSPCMIQKWVPMNSWILPGSKGSYIFKLEWGPHLETFRLSGDLIHLRWDTKKCGKHVKKAGDDTKSPLRFLSTIFQ